MDETTTDVVAAESGGEGSPNPETSPTDEQQGSSSEQSSSEAVLTRLAELEGMVRRFQSDEDRGLHKVRNEVKDLSKQLEVYYERRASGMSHENALREEVLDELVNERLLPESKPPVPLTKAEAQPTPVAISDYLSPQLKLAGLNDNDADVIKIVRNESDPVKQLVSIAELAESRRKAQQTPANPAAVLPTGDGQAVGGDTIESITNELNTLYSQPATEDSREKIRELGKKQKELLPKR